MNSIFRIPLMLLIVALIVGCSKDQGDLYVSVVIDDSQHVGGASVYTNPPTKDGVTDEFGTVLLSNLKEGSYEVYANLAGVGSGKSIVQIVGSELKETTVFLMPGENIGFAPTVNLISPSSPAEFSEGEAITFSAKIADDDTPGPDILVSWTSSLDGELNTDSPDISGNISFTTNSLSSGIHKITLTVEDSDGFRSVAIVELSTLAPEPVTLLEPTRNGSKVELVWTAHQSFDFLKYEVYRVIGDCEEGDQELITTIFDQGTTVYTDSLSSIEYKACYFIRVFTNEGEARNSNQVVVDFPSGHIFNFVPYDVLKHPTESIIYLLDRGAQKLIKFDFISNEILDEINLAGTIGYCDIGDNGYGLEVYVPSDNGQIYVYDANDLSLVKTIQTDLISSSVVIDGAGHVIANVNAESFWDSPLRTYDRVSGYLIDGGGDYGVARLRKVPGQKRVITISSGISPVDMDYYEISNNGHISLHVEDQYHGHYPLSPQIFRISDNGLYSVTSRKGAVYLANSSMEYRGQLYNGPLEYSDFAFSDDSSIIYAATSNKKSIQIADYYTLLVNDEMTTKGYPQFLIRDGNKLIALSKPTLNEDDVSVVVEVIDL